MQGLGISVKSVTSSRLTSTSEPGSMTSQVSDLGHTAHLILKTRWFEKLGRYGEAYYNSTVDLTKLNHRAVIYILAHKGIFYIVVQPLYK